jgi:hypothetical protein
LHSLDTAAKAGLDKLALDFPSAQQRDCAAANPVTGNKTVATAQTASQASPSPKAGLTRDATH